MRSKVAVVLVTVVMLSAGCVGGLTGGGDGGSASQVDPIDHVPADVDTVGAIDFAVLEDDTTQSLTEALNSSSAGAPGGVDQPVGEGTETLEETNLSVEDINKVSFFARTPEESVPTGAEGDEYAGAIATVDFDREAVLGNLREQSSEFSSDQTYEDVTVYEYTNEDGTTGYAAEYESGVWVFSSTQTAVEDVIDVANGNAETFSGDLQQAFDQTRDDGFVRFAVTLTEQQRMQVGAAAEQAGQGSPIDLSQFGAVTAYSGSYYTDGDEVGLEVYFTTTGSESAARLSQSLESLIGLGQSFAEPDTPSAEQLDAISTDQSDNVVSIVYQASVSSIEEFIEEQQAPPA